MLRCADTNPRVLDAKFHERLLKASKFYVFVSGQGNRELVIVVDLYGMDFERRSFGRVEV